MVRTENRLQCSVSKLRFYFKVSVSEAALTGVLNKIKHSALFTAIVLIAACSNSKTACCVHDNEGVLSGGQITRLTEVYDNHRKNTGNEILLVTSADFENFDNARDFAVYYGNLHNVGGDSERGVVIAVSREKRRIFILTGKGLTEQLPDAKLQGIINNVIIPDFKNENYFEGILKGSKQLIRVLENRELDFVK